MSTQSGPINSNLFLGLAISQAAHSTEEIRFRLFEVFPPARYLSGLLSDNLAVGFAVANAFIVFLVFWTYFIRVRPAAGSARTWTWAWALLELANGTGHIIFAVQAGGYFPGVYTSPLLLVFSLALIYRLVHSGGRTPVR